MSLCSAEKKRAIILISIQITDWSISSYFTLTLTLNAHLRFFAFIECSSAPPTVASQQLLQEYSSLNSSSDDN